MIITGSNIHMASQRQFSASGTKGSIAENTFLSSYQKYANAKGIDDVEDVNDESIDAPNSIQNDLLKNLMQKMMSVSTIGQRISDGTSGVKLATYAEYETTSFSAQGMAKTADGRTIDFGIDIMMSRSYVEYTSLQVSPLKSILKDPLVINVDSGVANISDQKFMFDLDADGSKEEISSLGKGSGFLALDLNEDGIINDGNELFGTKSGDGFEDLRAYDSDGNGWIDEADEVFSKLKVWCKGDNGEDILMDLKEAGVGAIFLGEQPTDFSMYGAFGLNGMIRSTGFFLKEDGGVGTVQHVDLSTVSEEEVKAREEAMANNDKSPEKQAEKISGGTGSFEDVAMSINIEPNDSYRKKSGSDRRDELKKIGEARRERSAKKRKELYEYQNKKMKEHKRMLKEHAENIHIQRKEAAKRYKESIENILEGLDELVEESNIVA